MTDLERRVAEAAVAANPAPLGPELTENVLAKADLAGIVEKILSQLVKDGVLVCENTMAPPGATTKTRGSPPLGIPPAFFKYTKGPKWAE
jgi:hypothetical protein